MGSSFDRKYPAAAGWKTVAQMRNTTEEVRHSHESQHQIGVIHRTPLEHHDLLEREIDGRATEQRCTP